MKKKIVILGCTGSIGKTTFDIIKKNQKDFEIILLTTNKNINRILEQAKLLKVNKTDEITYFNLQKYMKPHFASKST